MVFGLPKPVWADGLWYRLRDLKAGSLITWSALSRLSDNPLMRATVLIPLLGTLLLFNERTVDFFSLSEEFALRLGITPGNRNFELSTLYYTYFGLCCLGLGSIAFAVFCPSHIRNQHQIERYVENAERQQSAVIAKSLLRETLDLYWKNTVPSVDDDPFRENTINITTSASASFSTLMEELHQKAGQSELFADDDDVIDDEYFNRFTHGAGGYLNTDAVAEVLWARRRMEISLWDPVEELAKDHIKDIAYAHFKLGDVSRFWLRVMVTVLLGSGALLLLIPTARTFTLLFMSLF